MEGGNPSLTSSRRVMEAIEAIFVDVQFQIARGWPPELVYRNRKSWANVKYNADGKLEMKNLTKTVGYGNKTTRQSFTLIIDVLSRIYKLLATNGFSTKREIYYEDPILFRSQTVVDRIIDEVTCLLRVPRRALHIYASSKGCIAGNLNFVDTAGNFFDCSQNRSGVLIPSDVKSITYMQTQAEVVIVVEDDATFRKILEDPLEDLPPAIFVTGKGFPDIATRLMVKAIWDKFHLPTYALMDADPHGLEIMFVYRFGSLASMHDNDNLALPALRWLGVLPTDIERLSIPPDVQLPLTNSDRKKLMNLLRRPYCADTLSATGQALRDQIATLQRLNVKAEIQSLHRISTHFLCNSYLPSKLRRNSWI